MINKNFNWRHFVSLYIAISFLIMVTSGLVLFIAPPGRVANWSYWAILGLTKAQWQAVHIIFTFLFVIIGGIHIYFNWKPLMHYFREKSKSTIKMKNELLFAVMIGLSIFVLTINRIPPFSNVLDLGESFTESWENENNAPPIAHAERLTIAEFSKNINIPIGRIKQNLKSENISVSDTNLTISELAASYNVTPNEIYQIIQKTSDHNISSQTPRGYGRKTLEEICLENNIDINKAMQNLKNKNISASGSDKIKTIAEANSLLPLDIYNILISQ